MAISEKKFSLRKKLIVFVTILAITTYSTSAVFIYFVQPQFFPNIEPFMFTIITFGLGIFWSGVLAAIFGTILTKPLQQLEIAAIKVSQGEIGSDIEFPNSTDEIRSVAEAFSQMVVNLRMIVGQIETNFEETAKTVDQLSAETGAVAKQADAVAHTISEISSGADSSAIAIQETAESIEDIRMLAVEVNNRAADSSMQSKEMIEELITTTEVFHSLVNGIRSMSSKSADTLETIRELDHTAKEIGEIVQLVGNIAAQTNLLALNASIEAARAGEHGAGFAVVAEEVRTLADESARAVQGITGLVSTIQSDVTKVVKEIEGQVEAAAVEAGRATKTTDIVATMRDKVNVMAESVVEITKFVEHQLENIESTAIQSQEVAAIAEETSASALQVSVATEEQVGAIEQANEMAKQLKSQSEELYKVINQFSRTGN